MYLCVWQLLDSENNLSEILPVLQTCYRQETQSVPWVCVLWKIWHIIRENKCTLVWWAWHFLTMTSFFNPQFFPLLNLFLFIQLYFFTLLLGQTDLYVDRFIYKINNDKWSQADYWELRKISLIPVSAHYWNLLFILKIVRLPEVLL